MIKIILFFALIITVVYVLFVPFFDSVTTNKDYTTRLPAAVQIEKTGSEIYEAIQNWIGGDLNKSTKEGVEKVGLEN